jgi:hypothetical protein
LPGVVKRAVLVSALFSLLVIVLPARGLTFLWDDWFLLERAASPLRWFDAVNEHWKPIYCGLFALEHALFGANHTFFLLTSWALHCVNLALLGSLLAKKTRDENAAAIAVLAFGVATSWREVLWWACLGGLVLSFTIVLLGLHASERVRAAKDAREERIFLGLAALASFAAPLTFGSGLALGPLLALELAPRRRALVPLAATLVYLALYLHFGNPPHPPVDPLVLTNFAVHGVGLGLVKRSFLPLSASWLPESDEVARALAFLYVALTGLVSLRGERKQVACALAFLALFLGPIALARSASLEPAVYSRYQYYPALAWTWTLALALAGRRPTVQLGAALLVLPLAFFHAKDAERDGRPYAPSSRREFPAIVRGYVETAHESSSAIDRVHVSRWLAWQETSARAIAHALDPSVPASAVVASDASLLK